MSRSSSLNWLACLLVASATLGLVACGGGSGSSTPSQSATLQLAGQASVTQPGGPMPELAGANRPGVPMFGSITQTGADGPIQAFTVSSRGLRLGVGTTTPQTQTQVGPNEFPAATLGESNFIQFEFTRDLVASSILNPNPAGNSGIVIQSLTGVEVPYQIVQTPDQVANNVAPANLRLRFVDATGMPIGLAPGQYVLNIITSTLQGVPASAGGPPVPFCLVPQPNGACNTQMTEVSYSFTIGVDTTAPDIAAQGGNVPPDDPAFASPIGVNQEFIIRFTEAIDFQSIVGFNALTNRPNVTARDPFMSTVFPIPNVFTAGCPPVTFTSAGENIVVNYAAPAGTALCPQTYGFVAYMPDPFHNPREVRVRIIDMSIRNSIDLASIPQNYGIDSAVYTASGVPAPTNALGLRLSLPPRLPVPGTQGTNSANPGTATFTMRLLPTGDPLATDASFFIDGVVGVTDRARNTIMPANVPDLTFSYIFATGPNFSNNPSPPDVTYIAAANRLTAISSGRLTTNALPFGPLTGQLSVPPGGVLDNPTVLGQVLDVEFGTFLTPGNSVLNAPRAPFPVAVIAMGGDPAIPTPAGGNPIWSVQNELLAPNMFVIPQPAPLPFCPLGVRLYVADGNDANRLKVFDSTTYQMVAQVNGVPTPGGVAIDPTQSFIYVSNRDQATVQKIGANPGSAVTFHQVVGTTSVGVQPRAVTIQPTGEDVIIANVGANTISFVDISTFLERAQLPVGSGPREIFAGGRMLCMGCTLAYSAYITNFFDNSVSIYESDSISPQVFNGPEGRIFTTLGGFQGPALGDWNRRTFLTGLQNFNDPGFFIANSTGGTVQLGNLVNFGLAPPIGFMGPPEFRNYTITTSFGGPGSLGSPGDAKLNSFSILNLGNPIDGITYPYDLPLRVLMVSYPAAGQVATFDIQTNSFLGSFAIPGTAMYTASDQ